jgi:hypothetical protein
MSRLLMEKKMRKTHRWFLILILLIALLPGCTLWEGFFPGVAPGENPALLPPYPEPPPPPKERVLPPPEAQLLPARPIRGDHTLLEIGPFLKEPEIKVESGLRGHWSLPFWHQDRVYLLLAVSYFNEPGPYPIALEVLLDGEKIWEAEVILEVVEGDFTHQRFTMPASRTEGWTNTQLAKDREKTRLAREETLPFPLWEGAFQWPFIGRVSSDYGAMRSINNQAPTRHNGIDIAARQGTPLAAANRGIVRLAEHLLASGNIIIIDHGLDVCSAYLHLHEIFVEVGQWVEKGEIIGTVGMTGYATGPHLHWSVYVGHTPVSPYSFMNTDFASFVLTADPTWGPF